MFFNLGNLPFTQAMNHLPSERVVFQDYVQNMLPGSSGVTGLTPPQAAAPQLSNDTVERYLYDHRHSDWTNYVNRELQRLMPGVDLNVDHEPTVPTGGEGGSTSDVQVVNPVFGDGTSGYSGGNSGNLAGTTSGTPLTTAQATQSASDAARQTLSHWTSPDGRVHDYLDARTQALIPYDNGLPVNHNQLPMPDLVGGT